MPPREGEAILRRFPPANDADRAAVLRYVSDAPLRYGDWKFLKSLYKQAEKAREAAILGTIIGRLDAERLSGGAWLGPLWLGGQPAGQVEALFWFGARPPGEIAAVAAAGDTLYVASADHPGYSRSDGDIRLVDVSNPAQPALLGTIELRSSRALAVQGEFLFVAGRGLRVVDVSDPRRPRSIGQLDTGLLRAIDAKGRYLYALQEATGQSPGGLVVIDVSDPTRPTRVGFVEIAGARDMAISGNLAYIVGEGRRSWMGLRAAGGLTVVDLSNPSRPRPAGEATIANAEAVAVFGSYLYICAWDRLRRAANLHVFHLYSPATPKLAGAVTIGQQWQGMGARWNLAARGQHLFVASVHTGLRVFNVANPTRPVVAATYPAYAAAMALMDTVLCAAGGYGSLSLFDISNPTRPTLLGKPPTRNTLGYVKRRARRHLRHLAATDPSYFAQVAYHALATSGRLRTELDPADQWVSVDILFGGSGRYAQASHSEGACYARWQQRFRRRREERAPNGWDSRPDLAQRLLALPAAPWQSREAALKMLRDQRVPVPELPNGALLTMLQSPAVILVSAGAREAARQWLAGSEMEPETAALAFFTSNRVTRQRLAESPLLARGQAESDHTAEWDARFAERLARLVAEWSVDRTPGGRVIAAAALLAERFAGSVGGETLLPTVIALLTSERQELQALASALIATATTGAAPQWLEALLRLPATRRDQALEKLVDAVRGREIDLSTSRQLAFASTAWEREAGWRLLAALPAPPHVTAALWTELLAAEGLPPSLMTALHSAAALETLRLARLVATDLDARLSERAMRSELLTPELAADLARVAPLGIVMRMITEAQPAEWTRLRDPLLEGVEQSGRLREFWLSAWPALEEDRTGSLNRRLLEDEQVASTFLEVEGSEFLESRYPGVASLLLRWLDWQRERFPRDSQELLAAATAPLAEVRQWGLQQVARLGMELPFALRLMESGLPNALEMGRAFFQALPPGDEQELDFALALCDSPEAAVRAYGREYVRERWSSLPQPELFHHLSEHADPLMQEFVARLLLDEPGVTADTGEFDRAVLRAPDRSRRAKELVKRRQQHVAADEIPLLLELARGRTARDAEWAWSQLARLALEGHAIEGFDVSEAEARAPRAGG
jgi:hypothetical protein